MLSSSCAIISNENDSVFQMCSTLDMTDVSHPFLPSSSFPLMV
jgi:hypothetical protein